jgi:hypothetical protein
MKEYIVFLVVVIFCACQVRESKKYKNCSYTIEDFLVNTDTTKIKVHFYPTKEGYEIEDNHKKLQVGGLYKFDNQGRLKAYYFLLNRHNDFNSGIEYDTMGNIAKSFLYNKVLYWELQKSSSDSFYVTFYLYGIMQKYEDVRLLINGQIQKIDLHKSSNLSNLWATSVKIRKDPRYENCILQAMSVNECTQQKQPILDTLKIPYSEL